MAFAELTLRSTVLRMDVKVSVIIPEDRRDYRNDEKGKLYKSLYVLHGTSEDNSTWLNSSNLYLLARDLDVFIIFPSGYNMCYVDTKFGFLMHTFITEELPAKMTRLFPISDKRENTFIMGDSMGGYGALYSSLMRPDLYSKAAILSSGGFRRIKHVYDTGAPDLDGLMKEKYDRGEKLCDYLMVCGNQDFLYNDVKEFADWVHENCPNLVYDARFYDGKHDFFFWNSVLPEVLQFLGF